MKINKRFNISQRIFALLSLVLLISNIFLTVALAGEGDSNGFATIFEVGKKKSIFFKDKELKVDIGGGGGSTTFTVKDSDLIDNEFWWFDFITGGGVDGVYSISASYTDRKGDKKPVKYKIVRANLKGPKRKTNGWDNTVGIAVPTMSSGTNDLPSPEEIKKGNTDVNIIMESDFHYGIRLYDKALSNGRTVTINISKLGTGAEYSYSNVPSSYVTMGIADEGDIAEVAPVKGSYKTNQIPVNAVKEYVESAGLSTSAELERSPSQVESAAVAVMIAFGEFILWLASKALKVTDLTMDKLIFNKLGGTSSPIIDLTRLGGIKIGGSQSSLKYAHGIMANGNVVSAIGDVFNGFKTIAITIYIITFLYMGLRIIMAVGTPDESKSKKYIEYWITGAFMLFWVPYFFPAIPFITNTLIDRLSGEAITAGQYSVIEIEKYLGEKFFGEDATVDAMKQEIAHRLEQLEGKARRIQEGEDGFTPMTEAEAERKFQELVGAFIQNPNFIDNRDQLHSLYKQATDYIESHANEDWTAQNDYELRQIVDQMPEVAYGGGWLNTGNNRAVEDQLRWNSETLTDPAQQAKFRELMESMLSQMVDDKGSIKTTRYPEYKQAYKLLKNSGASQQRLDSFAKQMDGRNSIAGDRWQRVLNGVSGLSDFLTEDYAKSAVFIEMDKLEAMQASLTEDPMVHLKLLAKSEGRLVYAIAWWILLFQLFSLLYMYYKRVFIIIILVCLYPFVCAMYVIDKMGDGKAQSMQNWFKEFLANCLVQLLHAAIYVILINMGIQICQQDPSRNWIFLVMCTAFLFPAERLLRGLVGLESSTLGTLKTNIVGGVVAAKTLVSTGVNAGKAAANTSVAAAKAAQQFGQGMSEKGMNAAQYAAFLVREDMRKENARFHESGEERKKKRQAINDSRNNVKQKRIELDKKAKELNKEDRSAKENLYAARGEIRDSIGEIKGKATDKAKEAAQKARERMQNSSIGQAASAVKAGAQKVSNSKVGQFAKGAGAVAGKGLKAAGTAAKYGGQKLYNNRGKIAKTYGKFAQVAAGGVRAIDSVSSSGIGAGLSDLGQITSGVVEKQKLNIDLPNMDKLSEKLSSNSSSGSSSHSEVASGIRERLRNSSNSASSSSTASRIRTSSRGATDASGSPTITPSSLGGGASRTTSGGGYTSTTTSSTTQTTINVENPRVTITRDSLNNPKPRNDK